MSKHTIISRRQMLKNLGILTVGSSLINPGELISAMTTQDVTGSTSGGRFSTFSIVAYDPENQAWGVAVTSKAPAVGAVVPYLGIAEEQADDEQPIIGGALANQSFPDIIAAPVGLQTLLQGGTAQEALEAILAVTTREFDRQFGIVDWQGSTAAYTGSRNPSWAGHIEGDGFTVQGNTLAGPEVLDAVVERYTTLRRPFWIRLLSALKAGEEAGDDRRRVGRDAVANSAAIRIVAYNRSILGESTNFLDLRVDDDSDPIDKLEALMTTWLSFIRPVPNRRRVSS